MLFLELKVGTLTEPSSTEPSSSVATRRRKRRVAYLIYAVMAVIFVIVSSPFWYWIPASLWYSYKERVPMFLMKKGVGGELEIIQKRLSAGAYRFFWKQIREKKQKGHFPCKDQGWICTSKTLACAAGKPRFKPEPKRWEHPCWKQLKFRIPGAFYLKYCYKSEGEGRFAKYSVRATGNLYCDQKSTNLLVVRRAYSSEFSIVRLPSLAIPKKSAPAARKR